LALSKPAVAGGEVDLSLVWRGTIFKEEWESNFTQDEMVSPCRRGKAAGAVAGPVLNTTNTTHHAAVAVAGYYNHSRTRCSVIATNYGKGHLYSRHRATEVL
jgi:hypothetical protein